MVVVVQGVVVGAVVGRQACPSPPAGPGRVAGQRRVAAGVHVPHVGTWTGGGGGSKKKGSASSELRKRKGEKKETLHWQSFDTRSRYPTSARYMLWMGTDTFCNGFQSFQSCWM